MRCRVPRIVTVRTLLLLPAVFAVSLSGCYERVVRVEGLGSSTIDIYEPNASDKPDLLDDLMWGKQTPDKKKR